MILENLQNEVGKWSWDNFGPQQAYRLLLGVAEEVGELCHAHLKGEQKIRDGRGESNDEEKMDAVGDLVIFLADYCEKAGLDMDLAVTLAWNKVKKRDWRKYPKNGMTE